MQTWEFLGMAGSAAVVVAAIAWGGDRRRLKRSNLDKVGWMPWTPVFFWATMAAVILLALAVQAWRAG